LDEREGAAETGTEEAAATGEEDGVAVALAVVEGDAATGAELAWLGWSVGAVLV
jgi:hypothetical protein